MSKDPAFLFYSKDFYEATRTMLPKERACYIDLLIYQHQNEFIPNDIERISMYCSGIDEATLQATLQAKFKLCDKGWYNERLSIVIEQRKEFSNKQSSNGAVGQFFKKAKSALPSEQYEKLKHFIYNIYTKEKLINDLKKESDYEAMLQALLKAMLKHLVNVNEIVIEDVNEDINSSKEKGEEIFSEPTIIHTSPQIENGEEKKVAPKKESENEVVIYPIEQIQQRLSEWEYELIENSCKVLKITVDEYKAGVEIFIFEQGNGLKKDYSEVKKHFRSWLKINITNIRKSLNTQSNGQKPLSKLEQQQIAHIEATDNINKIIQERLKQQ